MDLRLRSCGTQIHFHNVVETPNGIIDPWRIFDMGSTGIMDPCLVGYTGIMHPCCFIAAISTGVVHPWIIFISGSTGKMDQRLDMAVGYNEIKDQTSGSLPLSGRKTRNRTRE